MQDHPDFQYQFAQQRHAERLAEAASVRFADEAQRAAPNFVPTSRWRDPAFYSAILGPIVALGFLGYFAQEILRAA